jgi:RNA polymerase sigma factor (sigma-70 family)
MTQTEVAALYSQHGYALFRRCLALLGDEAAAQDAVHEVFVRAMRGAEGFRGEASPKTWLSRIADHHCIDVLRRRKRNPVVASEHEPDDCVGPPRLVEGDDPETIRRVRRVLDELDLASRRLAILYFLDELTQEEIADELGLSRRTIGKRVRDLTLRMRSSLRHEETA